MKKRLMIFTVPVLYQECENGRILLSDYMPSPPLPTHTKVSPYLFSSKRSFCWVLQEQISMSLQIIRRQLKLTK